MDITHKSFEHVKYMQYNNFQSWYVFQSLKSVQYSCQDLASQ